MGQERLWESVERKDKKKKKNSKNKSGRHESGREGNRTREGGGWGEKQRCEAKEEKHVYT